MSFRSGTVALVGRPNAGKSTLLNTLVGEPIAAVSRRPQTTRARIVGYWNTPEMQVVLLDTPGIHVPWTELNRRLVEAAERAIAEVDLVVWLIDVVPLLADGAPVPPGLGEEELRVLERLGDRPRLVLLNKVDEIDKASLLPLMQALGGLGELLPLSGRRGDGVKELARLVSARLPEQDARYPTDQLTSSSEKSIVAEFVRERIFELCGQEVPYAAAVEVEKFDESARAEGRVHIHARILVEKESQKAILIGKGGAMIKRIGTQARRRIEALLQAHVRLDLFVVVERDWTRNPRMLKELGIE